MAQEESKCRSCGAPVIWIKTKLNKRMIVDAEPVWIKKDYHGYPFFHLDGSQVSGILAGDADDDPDVKFIEAYQSHFATCPDADKFRKPRKHKRPSGYR